MSTSESAIELHCRRTAAVAVEVGMRAGVDLAAVRRAALLHHAMPGPVPGGCAGGGIGARGGGGLGRLAWEVVCGEQARDIHGIVQISNLLDEQLEALEFEYRDMDDILDEIQSFAYFEGFDAALVDHLRAMRCRDFAGHLKLPVEAGSAHRVLRTLRADPDTSIQALEKIALSDPVLTGCLLGVANSALYGRAYRVGTVRRAIASIGLIAARRVMLAAAMKPVFAGPGMKRLWTHSVSSAPLTAALAETTGLLNGEEGLLLGLMHDIGSVALQFLPRETLACYRRLMESGCPQTYVEHLLLAQDHGEVGAELLVQWNFPEAFVEAVRFHHQPERSASSVAAMAYLAEFWSGTDEDMHSFGRVEVCLSRTGMTQEDLIELRTQDAALHALRGVA